MTAYYALCHEDHIELLTESAIYERDGTLVEITNKVETSESVSLMVTGSGDELAVTDFQAAVVAASGVGTYDGTLIAVSGLLERDRGANAPPCEILIAGISEADGPVLHYFSTVAARSGLSPWTLYKVGSEFGVGLQMDPEELISAGLWDGKSPVRLSEIGVGLFEMGRGKKGKNPCDPDTPDISGIGGQLDLTIMTAAGAASRTVHVWPDEIGKPIDPFAGERAEAA